MFEHKDLDGKKYRLLPSPAGFIAGDILEMRDPGLGRAHDTAGRTQYAVIENVLAERFLPPESMGDCWTGAADKPWWSILSRPHHAGIIADFVTANGGAYKRTFNAAKNIVAYTNAGEPVELKGSEYLVTRTQDGETLTAPTIMGLHHAYYPLAEAS